MSEIEWSPAVQHDGSAVCPESARGVRTQVKQNHDWDWVDADSKGEFWPWRKVVCYRIPMADYRRIYGDPLSTHPDSELDADRYSVGADTVDTSDAPASMADKYPAYYKDVSGVSEVDVYAVHQLFGIDDPSGCIHHASKKLLLSGVRTGGKSKRDDIREARDTLTRWLDLNHE